MMRLHTMCSNILQQTEVSETEDILKGTKDFLMKICMQKKNAMTWI